MQPSTQVSYGGRYVAPNTNVEVVANRTKDTRAGSDMVGRRQHIGINVPKSTGMYGNAAVDTAKYGNYPKVRNRSATLGYTHDNANIELAVGDQKVMDEINRRAMMKADYDFGNNLTVGASASRDNRVNDGKTQYGIYARKRF